MRHTVQAWGGAIVALQVLLPVIGALQSDGGAPCDEDAMRLASEVDEKRAYRPRGNRCEGLYDKQFSGVESEDVKPLGLYSRRAEFAIDGVTPIEIDWDNPNLSGVDSLRLEATSKRRNEHYQMDAAPPVDRTFVWPTDVLANVGMEPSDLSLLGWVETPIAGDVERVYVPLVIDLRRTPPAGREPGPETPETSLPSRDDSPRRIQLEFETSRQVERASIDLRRATFEGTERPYSREQAVLPVPVGRGRIYFIDVELDPTPGIQRLDLNLRLAGGVPATLTLFLALEAPAAPDASPDAEESR